MQNLLKNKDEGLRIKGHLALKLGLVVLTTAVAVTWFWSTSAVELFQAPPLRFSDAVAGILAFLGLAYGAGLAFQLGRDRERG